MTPQEKSNLLLKRFFAVTQDIELARQCAGLAVYEIMEEVYLETNKKPVDYWSEVRYSVYASNSIREGL